MSGDIVVRVWRFRFQAQALSLLCELFCSRVLLCFWLVSVVLEVLFQGLEGIELGVATLYLCCYLFVCWPIRSFGEGLVQQRESGASHIQGPAFMCCCCGYLSLLAISPFGSQTTAH